MATLTEAEKRFVVQALACYDTPSQVVEAVKEEYGKLLERGHVACYDPTKVAGERLAKKWRDLFETTRARFREEVAEIPIAQRAYRLKVLQRVVTKAENMKNLPLTIQVLEQAAKECGDMYVNRKPLEGDGKGGGEGAAQPVKVVVQVQDARDDASSQPEA